MTGRGEAFAGHEAFKAEIKRDFEPLSDEGTPAKTPEEMYAERHSHLIRRTRQGGNFGDWIAALDATLEGGDSTRDRLRILNAYEATMDLFEERGRLVSEYESHEKEVKQGFDKLEKRDVDAFNSKYSLTITRSSEPPLSDTAIAAFRAINSQFRGKFSDDYKSSSRKDAKALRRKYSISTNEQLAASQKNLDANLFAAAQAHLKVREAPALNQDNQKTRRNLVAASALVALCMTGDMVAAKAVSLGVTFEKFNQSLFLALLGVSTLYLAAVHFLKAKPQHDVWSDDLRITYASWQTAQDKLETDVDSTSTTARAFSEPSTRITWSALADIQLPCLIGVVAAIASFIVAFYR